MGRIGNIIDDVLILVSHGGQHYLTAKGEHPLGIPLPLCGIGYGQVTSISKGSKGAFWMFSLPMTCPLRVEVAGIFPLNL